MKYASEVAKDDQITMRLWKLFPGQKGLIKVKKTFYHMRVVSVYSANPEYVLNGPKAKDAGVLHMKTEEEVRGFLSSHMDSQLKLRKSMWAVVEFATPKMGSSSRDKKKKRLYTYDIEQMLKTDRLRIIGK